MEKTIQEVLHGIDLDFDSTSPKEIKMICHADRRTSGKKSGSRKLLVEGKPFPSNIPTVYSLYLYRKDLFIKYQSEQLKKNFQHIKYIVSFIGETGTTARFVGVYKILGFVDSQVADDEIILDLQRVDSFVPMEEKYVIDWGKATTSWNQYYYNEKKVVRIDEGIDINSDIPSVGSLQDAVLSYPILQQIIQDPDWVEELKKVHCIYAILDNLKGKLYVGSTYNTNGIYGRWEAYAKNGHGDDKDLNELIAEDPTYAVDHFQWTILELLPIDISAEKAIERESIWKIKLGTRKFGYNNN